MIDVTLIHDDELLLMVYRDHVDNPLMQELAKRFEKALEHIETMKAKQP